MSIFDFRRGGEPARILLEQYKEAIKDVWVDKSRLKHLHLTPLEEKLLDETKISYMIGKNTHLVPVIYPIDALRGLKLIANPSVRKKANVLNNNPYLFPSTRQSEFHLSGWHGFEDICNRVDLIEPENITFTKNRHLVSSIYSVLELPENERNSFYDHMGHSESMNKHR